MRLLLVHGLTTCVAAVGVLYGLASAYVRLEVDAVLSQVS